VSSYSVPNGRRSAEAVPLDELFLSIKDYSIVCWKCCVLRPTLRKWMRRFHDKGAEGLVTGSRKPKSSPATKILDRHRKRIRELRYRSLGVAKDSE
jgi:hypothetical protein